LKKALSIIATPFDKRLIGDVVNLEYEIRINVILMKEYLMPKIGAN